MNSIAKKIALLVFISITAISFQDVAQRRGGGSRGFGGGGGRSGATGHGSGFGGNRPSASTRGGSFSNPGASSRSFGSRPLGGSLNRSNSVRSNGFGRSGAYNRPSVIRGNSYGRSGGRTVVNNYNHTTVINRGYVHGGYYGRGGGVGYYHPSRPMFLFGHPHYGYYYHPFRPYYWGPSYHPIGFFTGVLIGTAIELSWQNRAYHYYNGVYYEPYNSGYRVIAPPAGIRINSLPPGFDEIPVNGVNFYYYGGTFYRNYGGGYEVTAAPVSAVVYNLPNGAQETTIDGNKYVFFNNTYFQPFNDNGTDAYEVVDIRPH